MSMDQPLSLGTPSPVKLTVEYFETLHLAGMLDSHRRAELMDGNITEMSPMGMPHSIVMTRLLVRLHDALDRMGSDVMAMSAPTIALPPHNAPEPDITLARVIGGERGYVDQQAVALVVEISVSTLHYDLTVKRDLYARSELPEYWTVDVDGRKVHQFWSPQDGAYTETRIVPLAGELRSATMPDLAIDGAGVL